jgi:hypothetical protein
MSPRPAATPKYSAGSPFRARPVEAIDVFEVRDRVTHDKFGLGWVTVVEAEAVVVDFGSQHVRVTSPYRSLTKL